MIRRGELRAVLVAQRYLIAPDALPTAPRPRSVSPGRPRGKAPGPVSRALREMEAALAEGQETGRAPHTFRPGHVSDAK